MGNLRNVLALVFLAVIAAVVIPVGDASGPSSEVKNYDACLQYGTNTCSTSGLPAGSTVRLSLTLNNHVESNVTIGSANLDAPTGFSIHSSGVNFSGPGTVGTGTTTGELQLRDLNIPPSTSATFSFLVDVPCTISGSGDWSLRAKQSNTFNGNPGNDFNLTGFLGQTSNVAAGGGSLDHFAVTVPSTPSPFVAGTAFTATVTAKDSCNNTATGFNGSATLTSNLGTAPNPLPTATPPAPLPSGIQNGGAGVTVTVVNGVGTTSITAVKAESGRTLTATSTVPAATGTTAATFTVGPASPAQLAFSTQPVAQIQKNGSFGVAVSAEDAWGNAAPASGNVTLALNLPSAAGAGGLGANLTPTTPSAALDSSGTATFTGLAIDTTGIGYHLTASYGSVTKQSSAFDVLNLSDCTSTGCSGGDTSILSSLSVSGPGSGKLGVGLSPPSGGTVNCLLTGQTTPTPINQLGSSFQVVPPPRTDATTDYFNIQVVLTIYKRALQGVGASNLRVCKSYPVVDSSGNPVTDSSGAQVYQLQQMPQCPSPAKKWLTAKTGAPFACIVSQTSTNAGDALITMLINSQDPWGLGG